MAVLVPACSSCQPAQVEDLSLVQQTESHSPELVGALVLEQSLSPVAWLVGLLALASPEGLLAPVGALVLEQSLSPVVWLVGLLALASPAGLLAPVGALVLQQSLSPVAWLVGSRTLGSPGALLALLVGAVVVERCRSSVFCSSVFCSSVSCSGVVPLVGLEMLGSLKKACAPVLLVLEESHCQMRLEPVLQVSMSLFV